MGVAETLLKENSNRTEILARILPNMASAADARMLVSKLLNNDKIEVQKLRREVGFALKPMLGEECCAFLCVFLLLLLYDMWFILHVMWHVVFVCCIRAQYWFSFHFLFLFLFLSFHSIKV